MYIRIRQQTTELRFKISALLSYECAKILNNKYKYLNFSALFSAEFPCSQEKGKSGNFKKSSVDLYPTSIYIQLFCNAYEYDVESSC